jgi:hypothetical protein
MSEASAAAPVIDDLIGQMNDEEFDINYYDDSKTKQYKPV